MSGKGPHKTRANPKSKMTRARRWARRFSSKITLNQVGAPGAQRPGPQGEQIDEDRTGRFIGRFQGAGQPPLPK